MKLLQNILACVDLSESTSDVIKKSISLAEKFNSQLTLMHVIAGDQLSPELNKVVEESVDTRIKSISTEIRSKKIDLKKVIIERGVPFEKIIREAQNNDYNVIVAGSGNKSDSDAYKLGTTVEKLIRKNQIPVWVVNKEKSKNVEKIVCPVDFSDASHRALKNAIVLSKKFDAELTILNVFTPVNYFSVRFQVNNERENKILKKQLEDEFNSFLEKFDLSQIKYSKVIAEGESHKEILKFIKENNIDLLLIGTTGKTNLSRLLMGSVTEKVTREVPCDFVTTKAKDITEEYFESNLASLESIINSAKDSISENDYEKALEKYFIALKQYPDNIPVLIGIIESYRVLKDETKVTYYQEYARNVVKRIWGNEYLEKFGL
jgi:nucleotide-binding universal stress UspA family protein